MKKVMNFVVAMALTIGFTSSVFAAIKCERDSRGNQCCWDTVKEGPYKPASCW